MIGDKIFRIALIFSIAAHSALFMPWPGLDNVLQAFKKDPQKPVEVNYLEIKIRPEIRIEKRIETKVASQIPTKGEISKDKEITKTEEKDVILAREAEPLKIKSQAPEIKVGPQKPKGIYVSYYNLIREKLRSTLLNLYKPHLGEGEVYLEFILYADGTLNNVNILDEKSTPSQELKSITLRALQDASPFPTFPKELNEPQVNFNIAISFRK